MFEFWVCISLALLFGGLAVNTFMDMEIYTKTPTISRDEAMEHTSGISCLICVIMIFVWLFISLEVQPYRFRSTETGWEIYNRDKVQVESVENSTD